MSEGFGTEDTPEVVAQFYHAQITRVGAEVLPATGGGSLDGDAVESGSTADNAGTIDGNVDTFSVQFCSMFETEKRIMSESEHNAMRSQLSLPLSALSL